MPRKFKPVYVPTPPENLIRLTLEDVVECDRDAIYQNRRAANSYSKFEPGRDDNKTRVNRMLTTRLSRRAIDYLRSLPPRSVPENVLDPWQIVPGPMIVIESPYKEYRRAFGTRAELGFSRFLGVPLIRDQNGFRGQADVGPYQVKSGEFSDYGLIVQMGEENTDKSPFALAVREGDDLLYRVVGYLNAGEAWELRRKGIGDPMPGQGDGWLIPQNYLRPFPPRKIVQPDEKIFEPSKIKGKPKQTTFWDR